MIETPVVLITGDSRGIGKHLSQHYLSKGYQVVGCSRRGIDGPIPPGYLHLPVNVSVEEEVTELFKRIKKDYGRLDVLVNNAAVNTALALSMMVSSAKALETMNVNFMGTFIVSREAVKLMMRRKFGRIINFGSMAVRHEVAGEAIYTASKAAIGAFSRVLAKEVYSFGITCNVISPSALKTDLMSAIDPKALKEVLVRNAIPELGEFSDICNAIDFLIRPESQAITGQVIYLGGT